MISGGVWENQNINNNKCWCLQNKTVEFKLKSQIFYSIFNIIRYIEQPQIKQKIQNKRIKKKIHISAHKKVPTTDR